MEITLKFERKMATELPNNLQILVMEAQKSAELAHAPYSNFKVGSSVLLSDGNFISGNNQENAAYPSGLCAERVAMFAAKSVNKDQIIEAIAIYSPSFQKGDSFAAPCGSCRQVMWEYQVLQKSPIKVLIANREGEVLEIEDIKHLLPFQFDLNG